MSKKSKSSKYISIKLNTHAVIAVFTVIVILLGVLVSRRTSPQINSLDESVVQPTEVEEQDLTVNPTGEQGNCPQGFYYFENKDFSLCYPNTMKVYPPTHIQNANGSQTDEVDMSNSKRSLHVLPVFFAAEGASKCVEKSHIVVSGLQAVRELNRTKTSEICGSLHEVTTIITRNDGQLFYIYEDAKDSGSVDLDEYKIIESSLTVK
jgi:hypothetical protein